MEHREITNQRAIDETERVITEISSVADDRRRHPKRSSRNVQHLSQLADELHAQISDFDLRAGASDVAEAHVAGDAPSHATTDGGFASTDGAD